MLDETRLHEAMTLLGELLSERGPSFEVELARGEGVSTAAVSIALVKLRRGQG